LWVWRNLDSDGVFSNGSSAHEWAFLCPYNGLKMVDTANKKDRKTMVILLQ